MAKYFLTKVWGYSPETYPALGFNTEGGRNKFIKESRPGDWVVLVGTKGEPTPVEMRGRLLGIVQLGKDLIDVEKVLNSINTEIPEDHFDDDGIYRWSYGLPMIQAKRFVDFPDLKDAFGTYLPGNEWAAFALDLEAKLGAVAVEIIESFKTKDAEIVDAPVIIQQRERSRALQLNQKGPTGPGPSNSRSGSERESSNAFAYLLQLNGGKKNVYKIGYSSNVKDRIIDLNKGLITGVTGYSWKGVLQQSFSNEKQAFKFEQLLHKRFVNYLVEGEREIYCVDLKKITSAWQDELYHANWAISGE